MFLPRRPTPEQIRAVLDGARDLPFSYPEVGATRGAAPRGYPRNHHRGRVGTGAADFRRAVDAVRAWTMYRTGWTELHPPDAPPTAGTVVAAVVRHFGFWSINPCRVVYTLSEDGPVRREGFAIGTLPGHGERGEERFLVEWHREDDSVWFDLDAFAGGDHLLTRLGSPLLRMLQRRFARTALRAVREAVRGP